MAPLFFGVYRSLKTAGVASTAPRLKSQALLQYVTRRIVAKINPELGGRD